MATTYPNSIDSFSNPVSTKVNGQDYVKAEHINDVQDAIRAMEISLVGSGVNINFGSNYFVPSSVSFKNAIEILDGSLESVRSDSEIHRTLSMITDQSQHHANVIEFSSGTGAVLADISPNRVQTALEVIRQEINLMLAGGYVRGQSLNDLYILQGGPAVVTGTMQVQDTFQADADVQLGSSTSHSVVTSGDLQVGRDLEVLGAANLRSDVELNSGVKVGLENQLAYGFLSFETLETRLQSLNDMVIKIDANGLVDGLNQVSTFKVLDAIDQVLLQVNELGAALIKESVTTNIGNLLQEVNVGNVSKAKLTNNALDIEDNELRILIDKNSASSNALFTVSRDGYTGNSPMNNNVMLQATETELHSGTSILKANLKEQGTFAYKFQSQNPGGEFSGYWVPFRQKKTTVPSVSIVLDTVNSVNTGSVQPGTINEYGFFIECDSVTTGEVYMIGQYEA